MATREAQATKLIALCEKSLGNPRYEYRKRRLRGVDMSHSDVETAKLYAQTILREGQYHGFLVHPRAAVRELIAKFGLLEDEEPRYA